MVVMINRSNRKIQNPVLRGFNPDPSILRVGHDYYIATSTFEYFPGVQIHHSRDLVNWTLIGHALDRVSQLPLEGVPDSGGVWAPCLSYCDGLFYLIYTVVNSFDLLFKDTHNFLVSSPSIEGPWSEPVYLNSSGFDPSLFHDQDGRKWLINQLWDFRPGHNAFGGIVLTEYDPKKKALTGPTRNIFSGTELGITEGPHLFRRKDFYYLVTAEGGTGPLHAVTVARSRSIEGPYEVHPANPILTSRGSSPDKLQKAGHASFVETASGEWYLAHLCSRPLPDGRCTLGRESAIQKIEWGSDDWPVLAAGENLPQWSTEAPGDCPIETPRPLTVRKNFHEALPIEFQSLRIPVTEDWCSLKARPGYLRLFGRESLTSRHKQSVLLRRQQSFVYRAETALEFYPSDFQQMAGMVCYYNTSLYHYFYLSRDEKAGFCLNIMSCDNGKYVFPWTAQSVPEGKIHLRVQVDHTKLQFSYSSDGHEWRNAGEMMDAGILSDENATHYPEPGWGFTGAFVGICCQDLSGARHYSDFIYFDYEENPGEMNE